MVGGWEHEQGWWWAAGSMSRGGGARLGARHVAVFSAWSCWWAVGSVVSPKRATAHMRSLLLSTVTTCHCPAFALQEQQPSGHH